MISPFLSISYEKRPVEVFIRMEREGKPFLMENLHWPAFAPLLLNRAKMIKV